MKEFRFRNWKVYDDAQKLFSQILKISQTLPKEYRFSLRDQLVRSSSSIILNIAEGSGKASDGEFKRFLNIAIGSAYEVLSITDILKRNTLIDKGAAETLDQSVVEICRQLGGLRKSALVKKK